MQYFREGSPENFGASDVTRGTGAIMKNMNMINNTFDKMLDSLTPLAAKLAMEATSGGITDTKTQNLMRGMSPAEAEKSVSGGLRGQYVSGSKSIGVTIGK